MPFTITDTIPSARVTIKFAGLILLRPNGPDTCDIGIHRSSDIHMFQVILIVDKPGLPLTLIRLVNGYLEDVLSIDADRTGAGFRAFQLNDQAFDPASANELDHRWAVSMRLLHPGADFNEDAMPIATLNDGVLITSNLTLLRLKPVLIRDGETRELIHVAADLAAALEVPAGNTVRLTWTEDGKKQPPLDLPRKDDPPGTTYTVMLVNEPPITSATPHNELALYYDVLEKDGGPIDPAERWSLEYAPGSKSDEIPCLPVELNP